MNNNYIRQWARLISESCKENDLNEGRIGISRPDELGKRINGILAQETADFYEGDNDENADIFAGDFRCNISDTGTLSKIFYGIGKKLPKDSSFIYFTCSPGRLTKERMVEYLNKTCSEVLPEKIDIDKVIDIGTVDQGGKEIDLYVYVNGTYSNPIDKKILENLKKLNNKYRNSGIMVKHGNKDYLSKYFVRNSSGLEKLDKNNIYLVIFYLKNTLGRASRLEVFNGLDGEGNSSLGLFEKPCEEKDIINLGTMQGKYKATGTVFELEVFGVKTVK